MSSLRKKQSGFSRLIGFGRVGQQETDARPNFSDVSQQALDNASSKETMRVGTGSLRRSNVSLADLRPGECGYIQHLKGTAKGRLRLLEMGLTPGTHVKLMRAAAFGGPLDIQVRGYQLSLRREEAAAIWLGDEADVK